MRTEVLESNTASQGEVPARTHARIQRVVHVVPALFGADGGIVGGAERYALELARHMAESVPTTLISFSDLPRREKVGRLEIEAIGSPWYVRGQRGNPLALALFSRLRKADVIHCHQQHILASSLSAIFGKMTGKRVVVSDLGGGGWDISSYISTNRLYFKYLHISEYSRKVFGQVSDPRATVILGGVDTERFSPQPGRAPGGPVVFVGRLMPHKGVNDLVNAVPPELDLDVLGFPYNERFVGDLKALAAGKRVRFRYECGDAELVETYRGALCVVLPSVYRDMYGAEGSVPELLGQTLLEGMACGVPAICTNVGAMPEVVVDGVTGFVVPPNSPETLRERLIFLRENPEQAQRMGRAARKHVLQKFTWPLVVERCLKAYCS